MFYARRLLHELIHKTDDPSRNKERTKVADYDNDRQYENKAYTIILDMYLSLLIYMSENGDPPVYSGYYKIECINCYRNWCNDQHTLQEPLQQLFVMKSRFHEIFFNAQRYFNEREACKICESLRS